jgi:hypothetical protein
MVKELWNLWASKSTSVDWLATKCAILISPHSHRHWIAKHSAGLCGILKVMHSWSVEMWTASTIDRLLTNLHDQKMAPGTVKGISSHLLAWHHGTIPPEPQTPSISGLTAVISPQRLVP